MRYNKMIILTKGKQNFWSQLLLSMIALFTLPNAQQDITNQIPQQRSESYQSFATIEQTQQTTKSIIQKTAVSQISTSKQPIAKLAECRPHFTDLIINPQAPIRAGPHHLQA